MAGDIRETSSNPASPGAPTQSQPIAFPNTNPESQPNTPPPSIPVVNPDGQKQEYTLKDGLKTIHWRDISQVYMYPCVRESGVSGIAAGFGIGGLRALFGAPVWKSCNWAVGTFMATAIAAHEICTYKRKHEKLLMKRAVEIQHIKQKEAYKIKKQIMEDRQRKRKEEEEEEKKKRGWWRFW